MSWKKLFMLLLRKILGSNIGCLVISLKEFGTLGYLCLFNVEACKTKSGGSSNQCWFRPWHTQYRAKLYIKFRIIAYTARHSRSHCKTWIQTLGKLSISGKKKNFEFNISLIWFNVILIWSNSGKMLAQYQSMLVQCLSNVGQVSVDLTDLRY